MSVVPDVDDGAAGDFLRAFFGRPVGEVVLVGEGYWSRCFGFSLDGRDLVVRFGAHLDDFERDQIASGWSGPDLPVPEMVAVVDGPGGHAAISARVYGVPLETLDAAGWAAVLPSLFDTFDATRSVHLSGMVGYGEWGADRRAPHDSWANFLRSTGDDLPGNRVHGWRDALAAHPVGDATFSAGLARLEELADGLVVSRHVIHADLLNRNVLVDHGRVAGVFDWGCSLFGDHLYDLATLLIWSAWYPALGAVDVRAAARSHLTKVGADIESFDDRLLACQLHIALTNLSYSAFVANDAVAWISDRLADLL